jgi:RNA-directed DNA polymerase
MWQSNRSSLNYGKHSTWRRVAVIVRQTTRDERGLRRMSDIIKTQRSLAIKATHQPTHQFGHLYRLICQEEWINKALNLVLSNKGAKTAGIDGMTKKALATEEVKAQFVTTLRTELQTGKFRPVPVRRIYISKSNGKKRPLGIPTLKDRTVQMLLKMLLEPIWESDFLNCSNGFRPKRRTMDCIALLDSYINNRSKFYWVIEGDIQGAFDTIHHEILLNCLTKRIADHRVLKLIKSFLKAGMMENTLFKRTNIGTPQGGLCSPLLANIYLHQLDLYWWNQYGKLDRKTKERRRQEHKGNCALIRYADDWLLLTNGSKSEAYRLRDEIQQFLKQELKLELSVEKSRVTHVNNGFDFLGFHSRRYVKGNDRPKMLVTPSRKSQKQLKAKIKEMTDRKRFRDQPLLKFNALNTVLRGWINYYCHSNAKETAKHLDFWVNQRLFIWLKKRHRLGAYKIGAMYKAKQNNRVNLGIRNGESQLFLYRMSDQPIKKYHSRKLANPYQLDQWVDQIEPPETHLPEYVWLGNAENNERWRMIKEKVKAERGSKCEVCGAQEQLELHHIQARRYSGQDKIENAQLLCKHCHVKTDSYGDHRRLQ